jgi:hypothetical protein
MHSKKFPAINQCTRAYSVRKSQRHGHYASLIINFEVTIVQVDEAFLAVIFI